MAPRIEFSEENVKKNDYDYPKFKLDKKGELARVAILESPVAEFVHNLRKPKLVGGIPEKETKTRFRDGTKYEDYKYEFVSRPICLGDYGVLEQDGSDPDKCPICAEAKKSDRFSAPQRRFALHVVKYETKPNSTEVKEPFGATTQVWSFTDKVFSKLYGFKQEGFNLSNHDILLKCENPTFSGYEISIAMKGEWTANDERKSYIKSLMSKDNLAPDLSIFCGSKKSEKSIEFDIRAVNEAWDIAQGVRTVSATDASMAGVGSLSLSEGLDELLDNNSADSWAPSAEAHPSEAPSPVTSFDELTGDSSSEGASGVDGFEDLLNNL